MTVNIRESFRIGGVLTNATTFVFGDSTNIYGVIRNDTGANVVNPGVALTTVDTGIYQHSMTEPIVGLSYTAYFHVVHGGSDYYFTDTFNGVPATLVISGSRYGITSSDLERAALATQIGEGISDRMSSTDATTFIEEAEIWVEDKVDEYVATPLKPVRSRGQTVVSFVPSSPTSNNFPPDFIKAVVYRALGLLLLSEFSENAPAASETAKTLMELADRYIDQFVSKRTIRVGGGRLRTPNVFLPPNIMPKSQVEREFPPQGLVQK